MIRRNKKTRKYQSPSAVETHLALECNFCQSLRFKIQVDPLENMNEYEGTEDAELFYFES